MKPICIQVRPRPDGRVSLCLVIPARKDRWEDAEDVVVILGEESYADEETAVRALAQTLAGG